MEKVTKGLDAAKSVFDSVTSKFGAFDKTVTTPTESDVSFSGSSEEDRKAFPSAMHSMMKDSNNNKRKNAKLAFSSFDNLTPANANLIPALDRVVNTTLPDSVENIKSATCKARVLLTHAYYTTNKMFNMLSDFVKLYGERSLHIAISAFESSSDPNIRKCFDDAETKQTLSLLRDMTMLQLVANHKSLWHIFRCITNNPEAIKAYWRWAEDNVDPIEYELDTKQNKRGVKSDMDGYGAKVPEGLKDGDSARIVEFTQDGRIFSTVVNRNRSS